MKSLLLMIALFATVLGLAGNESGHGGDPLVLEFHHRARFVLENLKANKPVDPHLIQVFEVATKELRVEMTDENLPSTGRVVPDPKRPGMLMVLLDRKKYYVDFYNRDKVDLNLFVAHEVWETKEYDIHKEITQHLSFSEREFIQWYKRTFQVLPIGNEVRPASIFFADRDQTIRLTLDSEGEKPGDITVNFRDNSGELELISLGASANHPGTHEVILRHRKGNEGMVGVKIGIKGTSYVKHYEFDFSSNIEDAREGLLIETQTGLEPSPAPSPIPLPSPVPIVSDELKRLIEKFNLKVKETKPWKGYALSQEVVIQSILEKILIVPVSIRPDYELMLSGKLPKWAGLDFFSNEQCSMVQRKRYFAPRLSVPGYSLGVGHDVTEECP